MWSVGVILYTLLFGRPPFETSDVKKTYKRIKLNNYVFPEHVNVSQSAKDLISKILKTNPEERPSLEEIISHEFLQGAVPNRMPVSTLACPPTQAFLDKYGSEQPVGPSDFNRTQGQGVSVPMSLNFKTKTAKCDSVSRKDIKRGHSSKSPN